MRTKTLILVHKEFLLNQWIERMAEFIPSARIGRIQGQICDTVNKDVVLGMIQTMYDREFPADIIGSFGLTIIDEVHRIGSEQFSRTLFQTVTRYMLGISATVERKDKLTRLLYMFIGPKIYSEDRDNTDAVQVRGIFYSTADATFNEVDMDYRGNPKFSTMISKLCAFGPRGDFIVRLVRDLLEEQSHSQIMILAHNRSLLTFFHEAIEHHAIGSVGFYVGGMKERDLKLTESKQIVLATYAMAAEALDIKSLSTLILATPKTDIIQSVGRILRMKHEKPIVVDIIDPHDMFRRQWSKRRTFYTQCGYNIITCGSDVYANAKTNPMTIANSDVTIPCWTKTKTKKKGPTCANENSIVCIGDAADADDGDDDDDDDNQAEDNVAKMPKKCLIKLSIADQLSEVSFAY